VKWCISASLSMGPLPSQDISRVHADPPFLRSWGGGEDAGLFQAPAKSVPGSIDATYFRVWIGTICGRSGIGATHVGFRFTIGRSGSREPGATPRRIPAAPGCNLLQGTDMHGDTGELTRKAGAFDEQPTPGRDSEGFSFRAGSEWFATERNFRSPGPGSDACGQRGPDQTVPSGQRQRAAIR